MSLQQQMELWEKASVGRLIVLATVVTLAGNTISVLVCFIGRIFVMLSGFGLDLFFLTGDILKQNILVLALWIIILSKIRKLPLQGILYNSVLKLIDHTGDCSICLSEECDQIIDQCHHFYHSKCIDKWTKQSLTCPTCRIPIRKPKREMTVYLAKYFMVKCKFSSVFILAVWGFLSFKIS